MKYRAEIDGLRAFAVLSVLSFHAFPVWLQGGFIGVDVFFVISGYLITRIIFEELDNGTFGFGDFFSRRVRRIFPALILVMAVSLGFGWYALLVDEYAQLGKHVASGVAFVLNFVVVNEAGYFDGVAKTKPMWHLWSLAVEEQFYIIWPLILWLAWKRKVNLLTVTIAVAFISFALNIMFVTTKPVHTFFWPVGRFWELLSGSALAWLMLYKRKMLSCSKLWIDRCLLRIIHSDEVTADGSTVNNVMSFLGLLILVYGVMRINEGVSFPGTWALVPVLGTSLIIASGSKAWFNQVFLMNPLATFFGRISYPLYLWHWPILTFIFLLNGSEVAPLEYRILAVIGSILLAWLTFVVIEKPVRARRTSGVLAIVLFVVLSTVGIVGFTVWKGTLPSREGILYPTADEVALHVPTPEKDKIKCLARLGIPDKVNIRYCSISSTDEPTVALIGDSHSAVLFHGLAYHLKRDHGKTVVNLGGRLFANVVNHPTGDEFEKTVYKGGFDVAEYVAGNKMLDTVIMVSRGFFYLNWADHFYIESKPYLTSKKEVFLEGLRDTLNLFRDRKVVFVLENPTMDSNPRSKCSSSRPINFVPQDFNCAVTREDDERVHNEYIASVRSVLENYSNVIVIDPRPVFCDQTYCYARKDGKLLYGNEDHLNRNGSLLHARQISKLLKSGTF